MYYYTILLSCTDKLKSRPLQPKNPTMEEVHVEKGKYKVKSKPIELLANVESRATISLNDSKQRAGGLAQITAFRKICHKTTRASSINPTMR